MYFKWIFCCMLFSFTSFNKTNWINAQDILIKQEFFSIINESFHNFYIMPQNVN